MKHTLSVLENQSLKRYNTFGIEAYARYFAEVSSVATLTTLIQSPQWKSHAKLILGGGSNILFTQNFEGLVIKNNIQGIHITKEDQDHCWLKVGAGQNWHDLVLHCVEKNYAGIENLSLIPGSVGAAPVQNIGAYGVELKETFEELSAISLHDASTRVFKKQECQFGYRDSVFKHVFKNQYVITHVTLRLNKKPQLNISYGAIQETINAMNIKELNIRAVSDAVIHIRKSKLPDPNLIGNAGSFFKNPVISHEHFLKLQQQFPQIPHYEAENNHVKIAAAWLIEQCGWKGQKLDGVGVHEQQALVLVNYGTGHGDSIKMLAEKITASVFNRFEIQLQTEVQII